MPGLASSTKEWMERELAAGDLRAGDIIIGSSGPAVVLDDPLLVHQGLGLFDEFHVRVGARVLSADPALVGFRIWELDEPVVITCPRDSTLRASS